MDFGCTDWALLDHNYSSFWGVVIHLQFRKVSRPHILTSHRPSVPFLALLFGANRENGNFRTLSVLCQVEVVEVDAAASENAKIDPNLT